MGNIANAIAAAFPDGPTSSPTQPDKAIIRQIGPAIEADLGSIANGLVFGSAVLYQTRAALYADLARAANTLAIVWGDSVAAYNGAYIKFGASGTGGWTATGIALPSTVIQQLSDLQTAVLGLQNGDLGKAAADIPSADQINITATTGDFIQVTGNETIQYFVAARLGLERTLFFTGSLILKHSDFIRLPGNADIVVQPGDRAIFRCVAANRWACIVYTRVTGKPLVMPDASDIPGLSTVIAQATAFRDQAAASATSAAASKTGADAAAALALQNYNDVLSFVSAGLEVKIDTTASGSVQEFALSNPLPAVNGHLFVDVYLDGHKRPKDGVQYEIVSAGTRIRFPANVPSGTHVYGEGAIVLAGGPISGVFPSIRNKGGAGGGANDTVPANTSLADEGELYLPKGTWSIDATFENRIGGRVYGPGDMVIPTQKGTRKLNSYADDGKYIFGMEYASAYGKRLLAGSPIKMVFSGDSTTQGGDFETSIPIMARDNGIRGISVYNRGFSGHTLQWWLANRMGVDINEPSDYGIPHVLFHRWGINDPAAGRTLTQIANDLWSGLAAIRATLPVSQLTIFLCVPNAAVLDPQRTEAWFEGLYRIYRTAARKFQCVFVDIYGYMRDNRTTSDWADSIDNGDGDVGHIHPDSFGRAQIRNLYAEALFPRGLISAVGGNRFWNNGGTDAGYVTPGFATDPSVYPEGVSLDRALVTNGFPIDGLLMTIRGRDGLLVQKLTSWYEPHAIEYARTNSQAIDGDRYSDWTGWVNTVGPAPTVNIEYANGWETFSDVYGALRCTKDAAGRVLIEGVIKNGTTTADTIVGVLPSGFRPAKNHIFGVPTLVGAANIQILTNGQIRAYTALNATFTSLDGIIFTAAF